MALSPPISAPSLTDTLSSSPISAASSGPGTTSSSAPATTSSSTPSNTPSSSSTPSTTSSSVPPTTSSSSQPSSTPTSTSSSLPPSTSSSPTLSSSSTPPSATSSAPPTSANTASSTTSSAPPLSTSSRVTAPPSSSTLVFQTTSDGQTILVTSLVQVSASSTPGGLTAQSNTTSKGFFDNKGAVAGVFTVVGLVALAIFIALVTNALRKRRAKKFDQDVAEAAAEAAATAHAARTDFDDDDYGYVANRSLYTDNSHGTYSQQPLQPAESYNMSELPPFDPYASGAVGAGNAAGIGAAGLNRAKSQSAPYNAFAGPGQSPPQIPMPMANGPFYDPIVGMPMPAGPGYGGMYGQQQPYADPQAGLLEAAGLAGGAGIATGAAPARGPAQGADAALSRNKSLGARTLGEMSGSDHQHDAYGAPYHAPQGAAAFPQPQQYAPPAMQASYTQQAVRPVSMAVSVGEDPYAGYSDELHSPAQSPTHAQFAAAAGPPEYRSSIDEEEYPTYGHHDERDSQISLRDDEDYGYGGGRRVLKVANE